MWVWPVFVSFFFVEEPPVFTLEQSADNQITNRAAASLSNGDKNNNSNNSNNNNNNNNNNNEQKSRLLCWDGQPLLAWSKRVSQVVAMAGRHLVSSFLFGVDFNSAASPLWTRSINRKDKSSRLDGLVHYSWPARRTTWGGRRWPPPDNRPPF